MPPALEASTAAVLMPPAVTPEPQFEEVTVLADSVIGIRLDRPVSSETARVEDRVTATVVRDVSVDGLTAIPSGSVLEGTVTAVDRGGRFRERARVGIRFTSVVLPDNTRIRIQTESITRVGEPPAGESTSKIGASAVVGAILGAVIGGKKGAAIGGAAGAAGGTAAVMADERQEVVMPVGTPLTVKVTAPFAVLLPALR